MNAKTKIVSTNVGGRIHLRVNGEIDWVVTQLISRTGKLTINYFLGPIVAEIAAFSLFRATGNQYSQLAAIK